MEHKTKELNDPLVIFCVGLSISNPASILSTRAHYWGLGFLTHSIFQKNTRLRPLILLSDTLSLFLMCLYSPPLVIRPLRLFRILAPPTLPLTLAPAATTTALLPLYPGVYPPPKIGPQ